MTQTTDIAQLAVLNAARTALSTTTRLLRDVGQPAWADDVIRATTRKEGRPTVVLVGERDKGKTTLTTLLSPESQQAPPVDSSVYRLVRPPKEDRPPLRWVYPDGTKSVDESADMEPLGVEISAPGRLESQPVLLDTPSTGGLGGAQAQLSLLMLDEASVVVFVTDAGSALTSAEVRYLRSCLDRVDSAVVAVMKTDLYPASSRQVVEENQRIVAQQIAGAHRVRVIGISAPMASSADAMEPGDTQQRLLAASGVPALVTVLDETLRRAEHAPLLNALRLATSALGEARRTVEVRHAAIDAIPGVGAALEGEQARLTALKDLQSRWTLYLDRDLGSFRAAANRRVKAELDEWVDAWRLRLDAVAKLRKEETGQRLSNEIVAELQERRQRLIAAADEELQHLVVTLFSDLSLPDALVEAMELRPSIDDGPRFRSVPEAQQVNPQNLMALWFGSQIGRTVAGLLRGAVGDPTGLVMAGAGGWFAVTRMHQRTVQERTRFKNEIQRLAVAEHAAIMEHIDTRVRLLKPEIVVSYRAVLQQSLNEVQDLIRTYRQQESKSAETRAQERDGVERLLVRLGEQAADVERRLEQLRRH